MSSQPRIRIQVPPEHYTAPSYMGSSREASFRIQEALASDRDPVLEIGIGPGVLAQRLRAKGLRLVTMDIDWRLGPDLAGSITHLPFRDRAFPTIMAFEVLEHLPLELLPAAIHDLCRATSDQVVISVPQKTDRLRTFISLHILRRKWNDPQHHWELGLFMSRSRLLRLFARERFGLVDYDASHPVHRFFVFTRSGQPPGKARLFMMKRGRKPSTPRPRTTSTAK